MGRGIQSARALHIFGSRGENRAHHAPDFPRAALFICAAVKVSLYVYNHELECAGGVFVAAVVGIIHCRGREGFRFFVS